MIDAAAGKPLVITEIGYPSSTVVGSSTTRQQIYFANVFDVLQSLSGRIVAANFYQMSDMPSDTVASLVAYYNTWNPAAFGGYLGSLGVVDASGVPKPAWNTFAARGAAFLGPVCTTQ
jgi:hypothetical protein